MVCEYTLEVEAMDNENMQTFINTIEKHKRYINGMSILQPKIDFKEVKITIPCSNYSFLMKLLDAVLRNLDYSKICIKHPLPHSSIEKKEELEISPQTENLKEEIKKIAESSSNAKELANRLGPYIHKYGKPAVIYALKAIAVLEPEYAPLCLATIKILQ